MTFYHVTDETKPSEGVVLTYKGGLMHEEPVETHITAKCDKDAEKTTLQYDTCDFNPSGGYICKFSGKGKAACPIAGCTICGLGVLGLIMVM